MSSASELRRLVNSYQLSQAIHVAAVLGIADLLTDGPRSSDELATATETNPGALYRLLRALAAFGLFHEENNGRFTLTELGDALRADAPESVAGWAAFVGRRNIRDAWSSLEESIRTGENAFKLAHGVSVWEYRAQNPVESEIFDRAMASSSKLVIGSLIEAYDFGRFGTIVDVGGGNGTLLHALTRRNIRGWTACSSTSPCRRGRRFRRARKSRRGQLLRVGARGRRRLPPEMDHPRLERRGLRSTILRNVRANGGTLLVVERIVDPPNEGPETKLGDLNMLVGPGGQERTLDEFRSLFEAAGYELAGETPTASGMHVIEGTPA